MNKVIAGEQSGISKRNNWQGGGSFVYCELAKLNQKFVEAIQDAENDKELASIWVKIRESGFISSYVDPKDINPEAADFNALSFNDKKRLFITLLDKNMITMLIINYVFVKYSIIIVGMSRDILVNYIPLCVKSG